MLFEVAAVENDDMEEPDGEDAADPEEETPDIDGDPYCEPSLWCLDKEDEPPIELPASMVTEVTSWYSKAGGIIRNGSESIVISYRWAVLIMFRRPARKSGLGTKSLD